MSENKLKKFAKAHAFEITMVGVVAAVGITANVVAAKLYGDFLTGLLEDADARTEGFLDIVREAVNKE